MFGFIGKILKSALHASVVDPVTESLSKRLQPAKNAVVKRCIKGTDALFDRVENHLDNYAAVGAKKDLRSAELVEEVKQAVEETAAGSSRKQSGPAVRPGR